MKVFSYNPSNDITEGALIVQYSKDKLRKIGLRVTPILLDKLEAIRRSYSRRYTIYLCNFITNYGKNIRIGKGKEAVDQVLKLQGISSLEDIDELAKALDEYRGILLVADDKTWIFFDTSKLPKNSSNLQEDSVIMSFKASSSVSEGVSRTAPRNSKGLIETSVILDRKNLNITLR